MAAWKWPRSPSSVSDRNLVRGVTGTPDRNSYVSFLRWRTMSSRSIFWKRRRSTSPAITSDGTTSRSRKKSLSSRAMSANEFWAFAGTDRRTDRQAGRMDWFVSYRQGGRDGWRGFEKRSLILGGNAVCAGVSGVVDDEWGVGFQEVKVEDLDVLCTGEPRLSGLIGTVGDPSSRMSGESEEI